MFPSDHPSRASLARPRRTSCAMHTFPSVRAAGWLGEHWTASTNSVASGRGRLRCAANTQTDRTTRVQGSVLPRGPGHEVDGSRRASTPIGPHAFESLISPRVTRVCLFVSTQASGRDRGQEKGAGAALEVIPAPAAPGSTRTGDPSRIPRCRIVAFALARPR